MVMIGNPMRLSWVIVPSIGLRGVFQYCVTSQGQTYWTTTLSRDKRVSAQLADMMAAVELDTTIILNDMLSHLKCMLGGTAIACNATCHVGLTWHRNSLCRSIAFTMMSWTRQYEYTSTVDVLSHDAVSKWWSHKAIIRRLRHVHTFTTTPTTTSVRVNVRWTRMEWYY